MRRLVIGITAALLSAGRPRRNVEPLLEPERAIQIPLHDGASLIFGAIAPRRGLPGLHRLEPIRAAHRLERHVERAIGPSDADALRRELGRETLRAVLRDERPLPSPRDRVRRRGDRDAGAMGDLACRVRPDTRGARVADQAFLDVTGRESGPADRLGRGDRAQFGRRQAREGASELPEGRPHGACDQDAPCVGQLTEPPTGRETYTTTGPQSMT